MKKILATLLVLTLAFSFAACGNSTNTGETESLIESEIETGNTEAPAPESTESTKDEPTESNEETPAASSKPAATTSSNAPTANNTSSKAPTTTTPTTSSKPTTTTSSKPETSKKNEYINYENNLITANQVTVRPRHVYWNGSELVAESFIVNGYSFSVWNIDVDYLEVYSGNEMIARGEFGIVGGGGTLESRTHGINTFHFSGSDILKPGADLSNIVFKFHVITDAPAH